VKLEQEAQDHIDSKRCVFDEGLIDHFTWTDEYINANLWETEELEIARQHLTTALLWVKRSVEKHGLK
jgi:hypothetical protein